ncbi:MAG: pilus assembly PilX N-terminal domain-containing protein [candidate division Zixibacteria bacterium]|nr:pilus assembly PilX N-terminal domain-containing protein [candidate division Zixibacteria bacterium]
MKYINNDRGSALLITLMIMSMLTLVSIVAVENSTTGLELSYNQLHEEQAFYLAESGFKRALYEINEDEDWRSGFDNIALGDGAYDVVIYDATINPALADTIIVESTGKVQEARATVEAWLIPEVNRPFMRALFGDRSLLIENNTCTDSYNPDSGSYVITQLDEFGDIGSNATVSIVNNSTIGGDVQSATEDGISLSINSDVFGDTTTGVDSVIIDIVSDSEFTWAQLNNIAPAGFSGTGYTHNSITGELTVSGQGAMILDGGVYYFSEISLTQSASISVTTGESVTIYMTGDLNLRNKSSINKNGNPSDLIIYSRGSNIIIGQLTSFSGAILAPYATYSLANNSDVYGSVVARNIAVTNHACFHYARNLGAIEKGSTGWMLLTAWREL